MTPRPVLGSLGGILLAIVACCLRLWAADDASVEIHGLIPQVRVIVTLHAGEQRLYVPYCGESLDGGRTLCNGLTRLEEQTPAGWRRVKPRRTYGVLGGSRAPVKGIVIKPGQSEIVAYEFNRRFFDVAIGQRLRVVIDAWPDQDSMKAGVGKVELTSPTFECPEVAIGY